MSKFKMPPKAPQGVQEWVEGAAAPQTSPEVPEAPGRLPGAKQARLTIDLSPQLHARFKAACAIKRTRMVEEVTRFIEDWTQKHS
jgi:hypothetical protein